MKKTMIKLAVSVFATTALLAETVTVEKPAGDGANTITQEIDLETGDIVSERMTCVHVAPKADAETMNELRDSIKSETDAASTVKVYRIEVHNNGDAETAYVVGVDGVKRPVVLVTPDEFDLLTERLDKVWTRMHESKEGRKMLHGTVVRAEVFEDKNEYVEHHKDGYVHTEQLYNKMAIAAQERNTPKVTPTSNTERFKADYKKAMLKHMSERQFEMRQRLLERRKNPVKAVSVEHDATTGATKVIKEEVIKEETKEAK